MSTPHAPKGDIKLPGVGPVPKKWFLIVGGGSVIVIGYVIIKRKKAGTSTAAAAGTDTGTAALSGQPCVDENGNPGVYDDSGTCQVDTAALGGYYAGTGAGGVSGVTAPVPGTGGFTTNGQWSQQAITDMQSLGTGVDVGTLAAALGLYIAGSPVTTDQQSLIDQAIAIEGYPPTAGPSGYPPAIKVSAAGGQTQTAGTCGSGFTYSDTSPGTAGVKAATGGTGYCVPVPATGGTTAAKPPQVTGLRATSETRTSVKLTWNASKGATSYQVRVTYQTPTAAGGGVLQTHMVTGTSYTVSGLKANQTYGLHVVAIDKAGWAPEASTTAKTLN